MSWRPPWRAPVLVECATCPVATRVVAGTVDERGRCAQCASVDREPVVDEVELALFDAEELADGGS